MSTMYIYRGLPGSGKTTEANKHGCFVVSPQDQYAMRDGQYMFNEINRYAANKLAIDLLDIIMESGADVAIAEVMPTINKVNMYIRIAETYGYNVIVRDMPCDVETSFNRNIHNVPKNVIESMFQNFEPYIK